MPSSTPAATRFIKRLSSRLASDEEALGRWESEIAILKALAGRGAPALLDFGSDETGLWLAMTKVEWPTLSAHLPTHRTAPWLVGAIHAAFGALAAVHDADDTAGPLGVVHGDISPTNVAVSPDAASALILDFGLAFGGRWPRRADGAFRGTVAYAAPEAARGEALDARADLFAMAATLLHIASGEPPRGAVTLAAAIAEAAEAPLAPWASRASSRLPAEVGALLERCVAHDPDDRPASARAVLATLVRLVPPVT